VEKFIMGHLRKRKEWFQDPCLISILVKLVVNLVFKFWGHDKVYESNHFLEQMKRRKMKTTPTSTNNKSTKVKRPRDGGFCFVVGPFFLYVSIKPKKNLSTKFLLLPTN